MATKEHARLEEDRTGTAAWKKWGPYLSERQWGTVREDYSESGNAWNYFTHDQARSRAYHWGEDGLAGISDDKQRLCFSLALWNGKDPILKERLFGLTNSEGNHGEDVKEYYFYLDSTPTHSYMKYLYKYPQAAYPYGDLVETNRERSRDELEYELLDTGVFDDDRYFDVFVEYAKGGAGRHPDPDHACTTAAGRRRRCTCCRPVVPQHLVVVAGSDRAVAATPQLDGTRTRSQARASRAGRVLSCTATAKSRCCSPRTKRTRAALRHAECEAHTSRTASTTTSSTAGRTPSIPNSTGTKAAAHYRFELGAGRDRGDPAAA